MADLEKWADSITNNWRWYCRLASYLRSKWWLHRLGWGLFLVDVIVLVGGCIALYCMPPDFTKEDLFVILLVGGTFGFLGLMLVADTLISIEGVAERK